MTLFSACTGRPPLKKEMVGSWKSEDGAIIKLNADGTFEAKNLPVRVIYFNLHTGYQTPTFNGTGKWYFSEPHACYEFKLDFDATSEDAGYIGEPVSIVGAGFFANKPPYTKLYISVGEPDGDDRYEFKKE